MAKRFRELPLHPFLVAIFPALTLLAGNQGGAQTVQVYRPLLVSLVLAAALFGFFRLVTGSTRSAGVLATLYLVLFFSYGHVYNLLRDQAILGLVVGRHRFLGPLWLALAAGCTWLVTRHKDRLSGIGIALNMATLILVAFPVTQISLHALQAHAVKGPAVSPAAVDSGLTPTAAEPPDIYYIILDRHARPDVIQAQLGYDDSWFVRELEARGFFVASCSRSNYPVTLPSMAGALNMAYMEDLTGREDWQADESQLVPFIQQNEVRRQLEAIGYRSISLTAYQDLQWSDADVFLDPATATNTSRWSGSITPFEAILLRTTLLRIPLDLEIRQVNAFARDINYPYAEHVQEQQYILDKLPELRFEASPFFAYIHVALPHPPYVFGPDGELLAVQTVEEGFTRNQAADAGPGGYVGQVEYIDKRMLVIIDLLLSGSGTPPVILLQGDHGLAGMDADAILNAYYVPDSIRARLYDGITPVNTFRLLLSGLFSGEYPLLEDASYLLGDVGQPMESSHTSPVPCPAE